MTYLTIEDVRQLLRKKSQKETRLWLVSKKVPRINIGLGSSPRWRYRRSDIDAIMSSLVEIPGEKKTSSRKARVPEMDIFALPIKEQVAYFSQNQNLTESSPIQ